MLPPFRTIKPTSPPSPLMSPSQESQAVPVQMTAEQQVSQDYLSPNRETSRPTSGQAVQALGLKPDCMSPRPSEPQAALHRQVPIDIPKSEAMYGHAAFMNADCTGRAHVAAQIVKHSPRQQGNLVAAVPHAAGTDRAVGLAQITLLCPDRGRMISNDLQYAENILFSALTELNHDDYNHDPIKHILGHNHPAEIQRAKGEIIRVLCNITDTLGELKKQTHRIIWTFGELKQNEHDSTIGQNSDKRITLTNEYFDLSSNERVRFLIREQIHMPNINQDSNSSKARFIVETQGPCKATESEVLSNFGRFLASVRDEVMQTRALPRPSSLDEVIRPLPPDIVTLPRNGQSIHTMLLNSPDSIVSFAFFYGLNEVMCDYPEPKASLLPNEQGSCELSPEFVNGDLFPLSNDTFQRELLDWLENLPHGEFDSLQQAITDSEIQEIPLTEVGPTATSRAFVYGDESYAPLSAVPMEKVSQLPDLEAADAYISEHSRLAETKAHDTGNSAIGEITRRAITWRPQDEKAIDLIDVSTNAAVPEAHAVEMNRSASPRSGAGTNQELMIAGPSTAKRRGKKKPLMMSSEDAKIALAMRSSEPRPSLEAIANYFGVSRRTLHTNLSRLSAPPMLKQSATQYPQKVKDDAVRQVLIEGRTVSETAAHFNIHPATLVFWLDNAAAEKRAPKRHENQNEFLGMPAQKRRHEDGRYNRLLSTPFERRTSVTVQPAAEAPDPSGVGPSHSSVLGGHSPGQTQGQPSPGQSHGRFASPQTGRTVEAQVWQQHHSVDLPIVGTDETQYPADD